MKHALTALTLSLAIFSAPVAKADHPRIVPAPGIRNHSSIQPHKARRLVQLLYRAALFRDAEPGGLHTWSNVIINKGYEGLKEVARGIGGSVEFRQNIQGYYNSDEILSNIYYEIFNREVDSAGYSHWIPMLDRYQGARVLEGIVGSQEFYQTYLFR